LKPEERRRLKRYITELRKMAKAARKESRTAIIEHLRLIAVGKAQAFKEVIDYLTDKLKR
jgi:hypothetical protein